jgi:GNAT superfamily N-acetyltransferase
MIVRKVNKTPEDFEDLCDFLLVHFVGEHQMGSLSASKKLDAEKCVLSVGRSVDYAAWVVEVDGDIVGSIGLFETTPWYSNTPYIAERWLYVTPEYRGSNTGRLLIEAAKEFANEKKLPLMIDIFNVEDVEVKVRAFRRMGMKLVGGTFMVGD